MAAAERLDVTYCEGWDAQRPAEVTDPASGANLIAFASGWGDGAYPTWVGRTSAGEVACFVADMLVVHDATVLP